MRCTKRAVASVVSMLLLLPLFGGVASAEEGADIAPMDEHVEPYELLFFHLTTGFRHESIDNAIAAVEELGADNGFTVTETQDPTVFNDQELSQYAAVVFYTDGEGTLNHAQRTAFERYIHRGGGFVGLHSSSNMDNDDWPWWEDLIGGFFVHHPPIQDGVVLVEDGSHPATAHLPAEWSWPSDEFYNFHRNPRDAGVHVLLTMDTSSYDGSQHPDDHPIAWCNEFDGGRTFYTALGHQTFHYDDANLRQHILGGIEWAAGVEDADCGDPREGPPTEAAFDKVALDDNTSNPMMLDIAPDGRVFYTELAGTVKVYHPDTQAITTAANLDVYRDQENGLLGIVLDPDFEDNGWVYVFYSDPDSSLDVDNTFGGLQRLSRFTVTTDSTFDMGSEVALLEFPHQRQECCHSSGDMEFDSEGNLYLSTGDDTNPFGSQNFAPIDYRPGREPWDAARTSGNTADLRGKVLRITPNAEAQPGDEPGLGSTYTVPEDNLFTSGQYDHLFPGGEYDPEVGRPEIYVMGLRNPFKIGVDSQTDELWIGDVGPDSNPSGGFDPNRGPRGYDSWTKVTDAANYGWPFCYVKQEPYIEWTFPNGPSGEAFDCENGATNLSPNNTGLEVLPPATERTIWYPYCPYTAPPPFPEVPSGNLNGGQNWGCGRSAFMGDVYHYDPDLDAEGKFPEYYDGKPFVIEWERDVIASLTMEDGDYVPGSLEEFAFRWRFDEGLRFRKPHDLAFGPDGNMYIIEWGDSFNFAGGGVNPDSGLYRISYIKGGRSPVASASATPDSGQPPLEVQFSSEGSFDPDGEDITFQWSLGDGTSSTDPNPTHTYTEPGVYNVQLVVTDESENSSSSSLTITVGNTRPEVTIEFPHHGQVFEWGDEIDYRVTVTDAEDGSTEDGGIDCDDVVVQRGLWHRTGGAAHVHPGPSQTGCEGTIATQADADHGEDADIATLVTATYTDQGGHPDAQALTGGVSHLLQPERKMARFADETSGISLAPSGDTGGGDAISGQDGAWARYEPYHLGGLDEVTLRASALDETTVEVRRDAPDGELLGTAHVEPTTTVGRVPGPSGFGDAVRLNGPSPVQYAQMPEGIVSDLDADFTIATWFNRAVTGQEWSRIFDFGSGQSVNMFLTPNAGGANNGLRFAITTSGNAQEQQITHTGTNQQLPTGWQHVAVTVSGTTGQLWINGEVVATNTNMTLRPADLGETTQNYIGASQYPDPLINGTVDDFNIFSRALSQSEIQALMAEPGGGDTVGGGDVAWYRFDEDGGATAIDSSGQGNDAELVVSSAGAGWANVAVELAPSAETMPLYLVFPEGPARVNWFDFGEVDDDPVDPPPPGGPECPPSIIEDLDEFDGTELDGRWTIVEHDPDNLTVADGSLQIQTVPGRDFFAGDGTLPNVVVQELPDGSWTATTAMNWNPTQDFQNAGLVVWVDEDNYVKAGMVHSGGRAFELIKEVGGAPDFHGFSSVDGSFPEEFLLRYVYDGTDLVAEFSSDGESWTEIGSTDLTGLDEPMVGVYATNSMSADGTNPPVASYDRFSIEVEGSQERSVSDDFSDDDLDGCRWSETVRYDEDLLEVSDGSLHLTTTSNDIFGADGAPQENIVLQPMPEGDWSVVTRMHAPLERNFQNAGFMVYEDDDNYLKAGIVALNQPGQAAERALEMLTEVGGEPQFPFVNDPVEDDSVDDWWLRLTKVGDAYHFEWSLDGEAWAEVSDTRSISLSEPKLGLYATGSGSQGADEAVTIGFDCFELVGEGVDACDLDDPVDPDAPTVEASLDPADPDGDNGWYVSAVSVSLGSDDPDAELSWRHAGESDWVTWTEPVTFDEDGVHELEYRASGDGGESAIGTVGFSIDQAPPTTEASLAGDLDDDVYLGPVTVTLSATDDTSGVAQTHYRMAGDTEHEVYEAPFEVSGDGEHEVEYRSVDVAGNLEEWRSVSFTIEEPEPPVLECPDPEVERSVSDDFSGDALDGCRWDRTVRYAPELLEVSDGELHLTTTTNDIFGPDGTPQENLVLQDEADGDWTIETRITAALERQFQNAGFIVYQDDDNYLKAGIVATNEPGAERSLVFEMLTEVDGEPQFPFVGEAVPDSTVDDWWLRLAKQGDAYTLSWSADGEDWTEIEESRSIELEDPAFGLYATGSALQESPVTVSFGSFELLGESVDPPIECDGNVMVGDQDSGVLDRAVDDETCLSDLIGSPDDHRNHRLFRKHVADVAAAMVADGVITPQEGQALEDAAARLRAGGGPPPGAGPPPGRGPG